VISTEKLKGRQLGQSGSTKLCRLQEEVIQIHEYENVREVGQGEPRHRKYKRLKLGGGQAYDLSSE
jgi:hypothetical protein